MTNFEEFVRQNLDEINELSKTDTTDCYSDDYLRLLNHCTTDEEFEIKDILKDVKIKLQRIQEIMDDCYSR